MVEVQARRRVHRTEESLVLLHCVIEMVVLQRELAAREIGPGPDVDSRNLLRIDHHVAKERLIEIASLDQRAQAFGCRGGSPPGFAAFLQQRKSLYPQDFRLVRVYLAADFCGPDFARPRFQ